MTCGVKTLNCARWSVRCSRTQGRQEFLAVKGLVLTCEARETFLDWLYEDLAAALRRLIRVALAITLTTSTCAVPEVDGNDSGDTSQQLFEAWVAERKPARSSVESWRYLFAAITTHFKIEALAP